MQQNKIAPIELKKQINVSINNKRSLTPFQGLNSVSNKSSKQLDFNDDHLYQSFNNKQKFKNQNYNE